MMSANTINPSLDQFVNDVEKHFIWCCRAIIWAIQQYDLAKTKQEAA